MQSCLEIRSMEERNEEIVRSDYSQYNQYSGTHRDALATGDTQGKGTGHGGHTFWLPDCTGTLGVFNYSNFDTNPDSGAGNDVDNEARNAAMTRSIYKPTYQYSAKLIDTSANVLEGQYRVP